MSDSFIYIPFPRALYKDIIRFSDGQISPERLAADQVEAWVASSVEFGFSESWGERIEEVAEIYAPHIHEKWLAEDNASLEQ